MNSSVTRTAWFAFWNWTESYAPPGTLKPASYPASIRAQAFFSSSALQLTKSRMSGWSALRMTILAARRVVPPDLIEPAKLSYPRMKETGPDAVPPPANVSLEERSTDRLVPVPEPNLNSMPSVFASSRIDSIVSSTELIKHAEACADRPGTPMLNHTGLLKDACWATSSQRSSSSQVTASSSPAK